MGRDARGHPLPSYPLLGGREGELGKRNHISACREDILCLASSCRTSKPPPPPQALHSLPCPYVFIGPASWCFFCLAHAVLDVANFWRW